VRRLRQQTQPFELHEDPLNVVRRAGLIDAPFDGENASDVACVVRTVAQSEYAAAGAIENVDLATAFIVNEEALIDLSRRDLRMDLHYGVRIAFWTVQATLLQVAEYVIGPVAAPLYRAVT